MTRERAGAVTGLLALLVWTGSPMSAQDTAAPPRVEDAISRYLVASRPGPEHRLFDSLAGSWKMEATWSAPGQEPLQATGGSENRWILGGRFLLCEATAGAGASRVEGLGVYGYDGRARRFFALSVNNLASSILQLAGTYDPVSQSFILSGKERDEVTGNVLVYRQVLKIEGPDRHVLQAFFDLPGRPPLKVVDVTFSRR